MISKFSVKKPYTVLVGVILVIVLGVVSFLKMTTDLLPNLSLPYVIVMTTYPGASPETVETVVTRPVESGMATVSNIESISHRVHKPCYIRQDARCYALAYFRSELLMKKIFL